MTSSEEILSPALFLPTDRCGNDPVRGMVKTLRQSAWSASVQATSQGWGWIVCMEADISDKALLNGRQR